MTIDSHIHFWNYHPVKDAWITDDMRVLQKDFLPEHIAPVLIKNKVDGIVAVQADQSETETLFLKDFAIKNPFIKAVTGWVDLQSPAVEQRLDFFRQFPIVKGFRHIVQAEPEGFLLKENFTRGIKALQQYGYTYDILVQHSQLKDVLAFINKFPQQRFIIDHCAKPVIKNTELKEWAAMMKTIAAHSNVYCKLSGLLTEAKWKNWNQADFYPYLDVIFESFGTQRLLFGSDWPVLLLSGEYEQWKNLLEKYMEQCSLQEKEAIFGGNAIHFYKI